MRGCDTSHYVFARTPTNVVGPAKGILTPEKQGGNYDVMRLLAGDIF